MTVSVLAVTCLHNTQLGGEDNTFYKASILVGVMPILANCYLHLLEVHTNYFLHDSRLRSAAVDLCKTASWDVGIKGRSMVDKPISAVEAYLQMTYREDQLEDGQRGESQAHELERLRAGVRILKGKSEEARRQVQLWDCLEQADAEPTKYGP